MAASRLGMTAAFALLACGSAHGQNAGNAALQTYTASPAYQAVVQQAIAALPPETLNRCLALRSDGSHITVVRPVHAGPDGTPDDGVWRQDFEVGGCGNAASLHVYFFAKPDGIHPVAAAPGGSNADLLLQHDAWTYVKLSISSSAAPCDKVFVHDTAITSPGGAPTDASPWQERWTLAGCGHRYAVPLHFIPDATGTTISADHAAVLP